jgi:hypothetical protein
MNADEKELLSAFALGFSDEADQREIEELLAQDEARCVVEEVRTLSKFLKSEAPAIWARSSAIAEESTLSPTSKPGRLARLRDAHRGNDRAGLFYGRRPRLAAVAIAAVLLVAAGVVQWDRSVKKAEAVAQAKAQAKMLSDQCDYYYCGDQHQLALVCADAALKFDGDNLSLQTRMLEISRWSRVLSQARFD